MNSEFNITLFLENSLIKEEYFGLLLFLTVTIFLTAIITTLIVSVVSSTLFMWGNLKNFCRNTNRYNTPTRGPRCPYPNSPNCCFNNNRLTPPSRPLFYTSVQPWKSRFNKFLNSWLPKKQDIFKDSKFDKNYDDILLVLNKNKADSHNAKNFKDSFLTWVKNKNPDAVLSTMEALELLVLRMNPLLLKELIRFSLAKVTGGSLVWYIIHEHIGVVDYNINQPSQNHKESHLMRLYKLITGYGCDEDKRSIGKALVSIYNEHFKPTPELSWEDVKPPTNDDEFEDLFQQLVTEMGLDSRVDGCLVHYNCPMCSPHSDRNCLPQNWCGGNSNRDTLLDDFYINESESNSIISSSGTPSPEKDPLLSSDVVNYSSDKK